MNIWVPQSEQSKAEHLEILSVEANFTSGQHSRPIIAMKQDAMTGGYVLTYGDVSIPKHTFFDCLSIEYLDFDVMEKYEHIKKVYEWKGIDKEAKLFIENKIKTLEEKLENIKQRNKTYVNNFKNASTKEEKDRFRRLHTCTKEKFEETKKEIQHIKENFEQLVEEKLMYNGRTLFSFLLPNDFEYTYKNDMSPDGKPVFITRGVMISGTLNKAVMGSSTGSISHMLFLRYSAKRACEFVSIYQMFINRWLLERGLSVGIEDCVPKETDKIRAESSKCFSNALLNIQTEEDEELLEIKINSSLNNARDLSQRLAKEALSPYNSFVSIIRSGAKGNDNNITQITSMLGQQNMEGMRMRLTFGGRALPHFKKDWEDYAKVSEISSKEVERMFQARGFVSSSFYKGLDPHEFFFHAVGGREGCIDTAVKTASTGYMQRKLIKLMEDLKVNYAGIVEGSNKSIISFDYGGDNYDGSKIIYKGGQPNFVDVESLCDKLNTDYEWEQYTNNLKTNIEIIEEDDIKESEDVETMAEEEKLPFDISDVCLFDAPSKRTENDKSNKTREIILEHLSTLSDKYLKDSTYGNKWTELKKKWVRLFNNDFVIERVGGRKNYDFLIKQGDEEKKVEFKFNSKCVENLPQFLSLAANNIMDNSYAEYFYDNYLSKMVEVMKIESKIPQKEFYLKKIHSDNYECNPFFIEMKEKTNNESNELVNESIYKFLKKYGKTINLKKLKDKIENSLDKEYVMWECKSRKFIKQTLSNEGELQIKGLKNKNTLVISSSNMTFEILLRWKNHKGVMFPAWQIGIADIVKKIITEDLGKIFEYSLCKAFNVEFKGKFKYDIEEASELCEELNLYKLKEMFPDFEHTANSGSRYDFTSKDGKRFLSAKTSKKKCAKIAPQCIGQPQPKKFCDMIGIEYTDNTTLQKYIQENITKILDKFMEYTFDCPIIYYNQELKSVRVINLIKPIDWSKCELSWSRPLENGSATLRCDDSSGILEIEFHDKSRTNITSRWTLETLLKQFPENFSIVCI